MWYIRNNSCRILTKQIFAFGFFRISFYPQMLSCSVPSIYNCKSFIPLSWKYFSFNLYRSSKKLEIFVNAILTFLSQLEYERRCNVDWCKMSFCKLPNYLVNYPDYKMIEWPRIMTEKRWQFATLTGANFIFFSVIILGHSIIF